MARKKFTAWVGVVNTGQRNRQQCATSSTTKLISEKRKEPAGGSGSFGDENIDAFTRGAQM